MNRIVRKNPWGGYKIRPGKLGWIVTIWSDITGTVTDRVKMVPYEFVPRTTDLEARDLMPEQPFAVDNADAIAGAYFPCRTIKIGRMVEKQCVSKT